jgi:hypothetical protein
VATHSMERAREVLHSLFPAASATGSVALPSVSGRR